MKKSTYNIVFSNSIGKNKWGGGEKWMLTAAKNLTKRGHNVVIAGKSESILLDRASSVGLKTEIFDIKADFAPFKVGKIANYFKKQETDICILNLNKDVRVAGLAARKAGVPVVLARHGLKLISDKWKYKATMKLVDGIITNSITIKDQYNQFDWMPENKTEVVYNGLNLPINVQKIDLHEQYSIPENHLIFGAAGRLAYQKGFDLLIKAAAQLKDKPFTFLIAGKGKLEQHLNNLIAEHKVGDRVKLVGFLTDPLPFLKAVDVVVQPSRFEGMPNTVLESMALGKPVIATEVNGVKELIQSGKNGFSCPSESVLELVNLIRYVADHKNLIEIGITARETIKNNYSIEKMIDHLETYFERKYNEQNKRLDSGISRQSPTFSAESNTSYIQFLP